MAARPALPSILLLLLLSALDLASSHISPSPFSGGPVLAPASPISSQVPAMAPYTPSPASPTPSTAPAKGPSIPSPDPAKGPSIPSPAFSPGNSESPPAPPIAPASSPSPTPSPASEFVRDGEKSDEHAEVGKSSSGVSGMSGGRKAGIAVGVLAAAAVVGLGALVYKKRRENIQRSRYGYTTRREIL